MKTRKELFHQAVAELGKLGYYMELGSAPVKQSGVYMVRQISKGVTERVWVSL